MNYKERSNGSTTEWLRPKEVAALLGVHYQTVKRMESLPFYVFNERGDRHYRRSDIEAWLEERRVE